MKLNIIGVLFAAGVGLALVSPAAAAQEAGHEVDKGQLSALSRNNGPDDAVWVMPALFLAGFAAGYGVRSIISSVRQRRAVRSKYGILTSGHLHQLKADNSHLWIVGDLPSPQRPTAAPPEQ